MIKYLNKKDSFYELINNNKILVIFYADWCGPCRAMSEVLEKVDFIEIIKINVNLFPDIAKKYGVMSIPTICYFNNGDLILKQVGFQSLENVKNSVSKI